MNTRSRKMLGERLVDAGLINGEQLELALKEHRKAGVRLGEALHRLGLVSQEVVHSFLAEEGGVSKVALDHYLIDAETLGLVPESFARKYALIPLSLSNRRLTVAMWNPFDVKAIDELQRLTGLYVETVFAYEDEISKAIDLHYGMGKDQRARVPVVEGTLEESLPGAEGERIEELAESDSVVEIVDQIVTEAIEKGATDIHVEPEEKLLRVRLRIDGILYQSRSLPKRLQAPIVTRIKIMANLNISESRLPQDGPIRYLLGNKRTDIRVSTFPTIFGEKAVLRLLDREMLVKGLDKLGLSPSDLSVFKQIITRPNGIVLVTGPTGSGKTTTLYSALSHIKSIEKNIVTLEDPVEYEIPLICQSQINIRAGLTFATGLRAILRQDPNIVLVGEIRDGETMEVAVRAALTGHLVFSTLHTNDAVGAIPRLLDMGIERYKLSSSLRAVISQRLVRAICTRCKEEAEPEESLLRWAGWEKKGRDLRFYRGRGCEDCYHTGYKGRIGIFEILTVTPAISRLVLEGAGSEAIQNKAREEGMRSLFEDGLERVAQGVTTLKEVAEKVYA